MVPIYKQKQKLRAKVGSYSETRKTATIEAPTTNKTKEIAHKDLILQCHGLHISRLHLHTLQTLTIASRSFIHYNF